MRIQSVAFSLTVTLVLALAASGLAFVGGRHAADPVGQYERGVEEGERSGRAQLRSEYVEGTDAYQAIYARGRAEGVVAGRRQGRRAGTRLGRTAARDSAFEGFPTPWQIGGWYLVNIRPGDDGARYAIGTRRPVRPGTWYRLCLGSSICRQPVRPPTKASTKRRVSG
jgi:hypothetical protein